MKLRRLSALLLTLALLFSLLSTGVQAAGITTRGVSRTRTSYTYYSDEQLMEMLEVSREELEVMKADCHEAVMTNTKWSLQGHNIALNDTAVQALLGLMCVNPEHFFVSRISYSYYSSGTIAWVTPV